MNLLKTALSLACAAFLALAHPVLCSAAEPGAEPAWRSDIVGSRTQSHPLVRLVPGGAAESIRLTGTRNQQALDFGVRSDEIVSELRLNLQFTPSPSLIPTWSQLNVLLNGQLQKSLPIAKEQLGALVKESVPLNPKLVREQNRITLEFVGHYQSVCESRASGTLWLAVDANSTLSIRSQNLKLANDLSRLPAPFIDTITSSPTVLPFVFPSFPDDALKTASSVIASYAGRTANWRPVSLPVYYDELPADGHFVVFADNRKRPSFLAGLPEFTGPTIAMADAPKSRTGKMLVIGGRDSQEALTAARTLASTDRVLIGERYLVKNFKEPALRQPYDAPKWLDTTRPIAFSQFMQYPQQLTSRGYTPSPVTLPMRLAPDLFMGGRSTVSMNLRYRYTRPNEGDSAQLQARVNGFLADSVNLPPTQGSGEATVTLPAFIGAIAGKNARNPILQMNNMLSFEVGYDRAVSEGSVQNCRSATIRQSQMEIDPTSTIDLMNPYHYAELPDLSLFGQGGFPFSRMADLSETVALVPANASAAEMTVLLEAVARVAQATGLAATRISVTSSLQGPALKDKDLLVVGPYPQGVSPGTDQTAESLQEGVVGLLAKKLLDDEALRRTNENNAAANSQGGQAAVVSVRSPYDSGRTVVALVGEGESGMQLLAQRLRNPAEAGKLAGTVTVINTHETLAFDVGDTYHVGSIPWYQSIWILVADYPSVLAACAFLMAVLLGVGLLFFMRLIIRGRQK